MKITQNKIFTILIILFILSVPPLLYNVKIASNKKALHIDCSRYYEINQVCFKQKSDTACLQMLNEDLDILLKAHKNNLNAINKPISIKQPLTILKRYYKKTENKQNIEPEILVKSMLIKKILLSEFKDTVKEAVFAEDIEEYIIKNFSEQNKSAYIKILETQNETLDKQAKKINFKKNKRELEEIIGR